MAYLGGSLNPSVFLAVNNGIGYEVVMTYPTMITGDKLCVVTCGEGDTKEQAAVDAAQKMIKKIRKIYTSAT